MFFKLQLYITKAILLTNSPSVFNLAVQVQIPLFSKKKKKKTKQNKKKKVQIPLLLLKPLVKTLLFIIGPKRH